MTAPRWNIWWIGALTLSVAALVFFVAVYPMGIEEPKFDLVLRDGAFEIRDYAPTHVAEVTVSGDQKSAVQQGFRQLAGYIFGGNATNTKIAMTAPVAQTPVEGSQDWVVRFTLPSQTTLDTLPIPADGQVKIHNAPGQRMAVLQFSGFATPASVAEKSKELLAWVAANHTTVSGPITIAQYNPPWTLWFLRRNEVMVPLLRQ